MHGLSPRLRILIGAITTVVFIGAGVSVWMGGTPIGGAVLVGLGAYRGIMWLREVARELGPDEDDEEDDA